VGEGSPYANLRYIFHKGAFYVRQTDSDILSSEHHPVEGRTRLVVAGREVEESTGGRARRE